MKDIMLLKPELENTRNIVVISHPMPDGDAFGGMLALTRVLKKAGHSVTPISPTAWGDFLDWMPFTDEILDFSSQKPECIEVFKNAEIIYCLDFNSPDRVGTVSPYIFRDDKIKVLIDHHLNPDLDAFDFGISEPEKSSTSEMVYEYIENMGWMDYMDGDVRVDLYTGMLTDTGSFRFPSTSPSVHYKVAAMKEAGLEHAPIHEQLFDNNSIQRTRFLGYLLSQKLIVNPDKGYAYLSISKDEMDKFDVTPFDLEGIVNMVLSIKDVNTAILISERDNKIKMSFRSIGDIDVSKTASENFNGGGHKNAAGGSSNLTLTETIEKLENILNN